MNLKIDVELMSEDPISRNHTIKGFADIDRLANEVGRAVKRWARQIPLRRTGSRMDLTLRAAWTERGGEKRKK